MLSDSPNSAAILIRKSGSSAKLIGSGRTKATTNNAVRHDTAATRNDRPKPRRCAGAYCRNPARPDTHPHNVAAGIHGKMTSIGVARHAGSGEIGFHCKRSALKIWGIMRTTTVPRMASNAAKDNPRTALNYPSRLYVAPTEGSGSTRGSSH